MERGKEEGKIERDRRERKEGCRGAGRLGRGGGRGREKGRERGRDGERGGGKAVEREG
jgi:hypothetical protein